MLREILASRKKIVSVGLPALIGQGTAAAWGVVTIYVARVLPSDAYAAYSVARSVEFFAALLGGGFVLMAYLKYAAEGSGPREKRLINAGALLTAALAAAGAAALVLCSGLLQSFYSNLDLRGIPAILALMVLAEALCAIPKNLLYARHRTSQVMWGDLAAFAIRTAIVLFLALTGRLRTPHAIFAAQALSSVVSMLVVVSLGGTFGERGAGIDRESIRKILSFSFFTLGTSLAGYIYTWTDILMLGKLASPDQVSAYGVCRSLAAFAISLNSAANIVLLPLASRMTRASQQGILRRTWQGIAIILAILLPFTLIVVLFPVPILHLLFDGKYDYGWPVLVGLCLVNLVRPVGSLFSATASGIGKPSYSLIAIAASAVLNLGLNFILIPRFGGIGAVISSGAAVSAGAGIVTVMTSSYIRKARIREMGEVPAAPPPEF
jgi:O-antigen/teichoic acid export membrane protein